MEFDQEVTTVRISDRSKPFTKPNEISGFNENYTPDELAMK